MKNHPCYPKCSHAAEDCWFVDQVAQFTEFREWTNTDADHQNILDSVNSFWQNMKKKHIILHKGENNMGKMYKIC